MSDDLTPDAEQSDATEPSSPPPWGEDFNPERAWNTISHLRSFEDDAKTFRKLKDDPDAQREFLAGLGYVIDDPAAVEEAEEQEYDEDDDPRFQKLTAIEKRQQAQDERIARFEAKEAAAEGAAEFEREVSQQAGDRDLTKKDKDWILARTIHLGNGPENLAIATKEWLEILDGQAAKTRPNAPHVLKGGKAATGVPDYSEMSRDAQNEAMAERAKALLS